eukprot:Em0015g314a
MDSSRLVAVSLLLLITTSLAAVISNPAQPCVPDQCELPDCRCAGVDIPGGLTPSNIPQIVLISFDDGLRTQDYEGFYASVFNDRNNPNGCQIGLTFFASHYYTNYALLEDINKQYGYEMAVHTIDHNTNSLTTKEEYTGEIMGMKEILCMWGNVSSNSVRGFRAPFLATNEAEIQVLYDNKFLYEASMNPQSNQDWIDLLTDNFNAHYNGNRAPMGIYAHSSWFYRGQGRDGVLKTFLDNLAAMQDVYVVTHARTNAGLGTKPNTAGPNSKLRPVEMLCSSPATLRLPFPRLPELAQKRSLRRKCEDYAVDSGVLYRKKEKEKERGEMEFLRVPRGVEERERILHSCHSSKESGHLGRDKTREKVSSRFFWKTLMKDVDEFVKTCDVCQSTNGAKFMKTAVPLHPIPIQPSVWHQKSTMHTPFELMYGSNSPPRQPLLNSNSPPCQPLLKSHSEPCQLLLKSTVHPCQPLLNSNSPPCQPLLNSNSPPLPASPEKPQFTLPASPGEPQSTLPASPGEPQSTLPASPGEPQSTLPASPGEPQSTLPASPGEPQSTLPASPGEPQSTLPAPPEEPQSTLPAPPGEPQSTLPASPGEPQSTLPASPGEPQSTLTASPAIPFTGTRKP